MSRYSGHSNLPKLFGFGAALALAIGVMGYAALQAYGTRTPDEYGCFDLPRLRTVVFADVSEPRWNEEQGRSLRRYFDQLYRESLGFNEELTVFTTAADAVASVPTPQFYVCGQATSARQLEDINAEGGAAGYLRKQRERLYDTVLAPELDALLSVAPGTARRQLYQSPILEMIADLSRSALTPGGHLIVISDLLQNSDSAQFCRKQNEMPAFSVFKQRRVYQRLKPQSFEGVDVEVLMLQRFGYGQPGLAFCHSEEELRNFYTAYFLDNGAASVQFIRIRDGHTGS